MVKTSLRSLLVAALVLGAGPLARAQTSEALKAFDALSELTPGAILASASPAEAPTVAAPEAADASALARRPTPGQGQALPNFAQVTPQLYRSGQPTQEGVSELAAKGVKTILKFNAQEPAEADWASAAGIDLVSQPLSNNSMPSYAEVDAALAVVNDPARQPVLVHCHHGSDRTGVVVAAFRVTAQGWSVDQAVSEALSFGYGSPGFTDLTTFLNGYLAQRRNP